MNAHKRRSEALDHDDGYGRRCAECGDTIDTIGKPGEDGTVLRLTRTGRPFRKDRAYCNDYCRRLANRGFQEAVRDL